MVAFWLANLEALWTARLCVRLGDDWDQLVNALAGHVFILGRGDHHKGARRHTGRDDCGVVEMPQ